MKPAEQIRLDIRQLRELPPPSTSAQRILDALGDDEADIHLLGGLIEDCPPIAARIVGLARSAYFTRGSPVHSVSDAIIRVLGLSMTRNLVVGMAVSGRFQTQRCCGFSAEQYWTSALLTATLSRMLTGHSRGTGDLDPDLAYLCGLLHNLGVLALAHVAPEAMASVLAAASEAPERTLSEVATDVVGISHGQTGAWLARRWHLPDAVRATMEHYQDVEYRGTYWRSSALTGVSARWSRQVLAGLADPVMELRLLKALGITQADAEASAQRCVEMRQEIGDLAGVFAGNR